MEMTQNQVYGVPAPGKGEAAANISMETNVGYGVSKTKPLDHPVDKEDSYDYI